VNHIIFFTVFQSESGSAGKGFVSPTIRVVKCKYF